MNINEARASLFVMHVEIGRFFNKLPTEVWVEIREFTLGESRKLQGMKDADREKWLFENFHTLITDHNLYESEDVKADIGAVSDLIKERISCFSHVMTEFKAKNPFQSDSESNADKSLSTSSTGTSGLNASGSITPNGYQE